MTSPRLYCHSKVARKERRIPQLSFLNKKVDWRLLEIVRDIGTLVGKVEYLSGMPPLVLTLLQDNVQMQCFHEKPKLCAIMP